MSAGVNQDFDLVAYLATDDEPWHRINCVPVQPGQPIGAWAQAAGLDRWRLDKQQVHSRNQSYHSYPSKEGQPDYWIQTAAIQQISGYSQIVRVPLPGYEEHVQPEVFSIQSDKYEPVQPSSQVELIQYIAAEGDVEVSTMGSLLGGRKVFALLSLGTSWESGGSPVHSYLAVMNTNDGTGAFKMKLVNKRIVCMNTFGAADREASNLNFIQTHRTRFDPKTIRTKVDLARKSSTATMDILHQLESVQVTKEMAYQFVAKVSKSSKAFVTRTGGRVVDEPALLDSILDSHEMADDLLSARVHVDPNKLNRIGSRILEHMLNGTPGTSPIQNHYGYASGDKAIPASDLFHHLTYYATHDARTSRTSSGAAVSSLDGPSFDLKQDGVKLLQEMVLAH